MLCFGRKNPSCLMKGGIRLPKIRLGLAIATEPFIQALP
ncbi:hypothetical protein AAKU58_004096 [Oxalobacteraceae bacterium GrIS 1.18]